MLHSTNNPHIFVLSQQTKMKKPVIFLCLLVLLLSSMAGSAQGSQLKPTDSLYMEIAKLDSIFFDAFNRRDIETFKNLFSEDLEFYHDKGGLTDLDYTINSMKEVAKRNEGLRRDLVKGSMEGYPIPGYGAMQMGAHTFCHTENGRLDCGTFKFAHVWKKTEKGWKITRVISYGH